MRIVPVLSVLLAVACAPAAAPPAAPTPGAAGAGAPLPATVAVDTLADRLRYRSVEGDIGRIWAAHDLDLVVEARPDAVVGELLVNTSGTGSYWSRITFVADGHRWEIPVTRDMKRVEERAGVRERVLLAATPDVVDRLRRVAHAGSARVLFTGGRQDIDATLTDDQQRRLRDMLHVYDALVGGEAR